VCGIKEVEEDVFATKSLVTDRYCQSYAHPLWRVSPPELHEGETGRRCTCSVGGRRRTRAHRTALDERMSDVFFSDIGLRQPDHHLGIGSGTHAEQTGRVIMAFEPLVERVQPDVVIVVGDVNATLACALVAAKAGAVVGHVEAGLRSRDWSMPEEINRVVTDRINDFLFAPSEDAVENLCREGYREDQIHLVGNVMIDTLLANFERARERPIQRELGLAPGEFGLVTLHRPANVDDSVMLDRLISVLGGLARDVPWSSRCTTARGRAWKGRRLRMACG
jgi:UDP-N-acetylglucosamine 2-epimerase